MSQILGTLHAHPHADHATLGAALRTAPFRPVDLGFAFKEAAAMWEGGPGRWPAVAYGLVALTGRVVDHARGYRGQRGEVLAVALVHDGRLACGADPDWILRLFLPGLGGAAAESSGGLRVAASGLPPRGIEYLEEQARRHRESWT